LNICSIAPRSAIASRTAAADASGSVQKYASQPSASRTITTRIRPPAGRQVARNVLIVLTTRSPYCTHATRCQPRRWPARLARVMRPGPYVGRGPRRPGGRFAGGNVLSTISDFFEAASEAVDAMIDRLHKTETLLHSPEVRFILVTTAEKDRLRRARELIAEMEAEGLTLSAIVINRFLDEETWSEVMKHPGAEPSQLNGIRKLRASLDGAPSINGVIDFLEEYRTRAINDIAQVEQFVRELSSMVTVAIAPEIEVGVRDLAALARVAQCLLTPISPKKSRQNHRGTELGRRVARKHRESRSFPILLPSYPCVSVPLWFLLKCRSAPVSRVLFPCG